MSDKKNIKDNFNDFVDDAKAEAKDFANDAKTILIDGKNVAIIAHIHVIGWIVALVMNSNNKTEMGSFYIRQMLGLLLLSILGFIPVIGWIAFAIVLVAWVMSLVSALGGTMKPTFYIGEKFQEWFKAF